MPSEVLAQGDIQGKPGEMVCHPDIPVNYCAHWLHFSIPDR